VSYVVFFIAQVKPFRQSLTYRSCLLLLLLHRTERGGAGLCVLASLTRQDREDHEALEELWSAKQASLLQSRWETHFPQLTDWLGFCETEMFTEDTWERILKRSRLCNDSSPAISMWITALHLDGVFFCVYVFYLVEHLLLMGLTQLSAGS
jgi:hypothetical protein